MADEGPRKISSTSFGIRAKRPRYEKRHEAEGGNICSINQSGYMRPQATLLGLMPNAIHERYSLTNCFQNKADQPSTKGQVCALGDKQLIAKLEVGGVPANLLVDTGASHSVLKWSEALQEKLDIQPTTVSLVSVTGDPLPVIGEAKVPFESRGIKVGEIMCIIVDKGFNFNLAGIVGTDFFNRAGCVIDYAKGVLVIGSRVIKLHQRDTLANDQGKVRTVEENFRPCKYTFSTNEYLVKLPEAVTLTAGCQQIVTATLESVPGNKGAVTTKTCFNICKRIIHSSKSSPVLIGEAMVTPDGRGQVPVLMLNYGMQDQYFNKGRILTQATESPMYQTYERMPKGGHHNERGQVSFITEHNEQNEKIKSLGKERPRTPLTPESIEVSEEFMENKAELVELLNEYRETVSRDDEPPGTCKLTTHEIRLDSPKPVYIPQYRIPHKFQAGMEVAIKEMLADGIIRESKSPFNSPIIAVPKANGTLRPCNDYRQLNTRVIPDRYPLPIL